MEKKQIGIRFDGGRATEERRQCELDTIAAKELLDRTVGDSSDVIKFLQRELQAREDQCAELEERLNGLQLVSIKSVIF